ncbi:MAG: diacylglycerol kinase family protein [Syntrophobacteraceae bacterium]
MKIAAIANPTSGSGKAGSRWPALLEALGPRKREIETWWTQYPGHAEILAASVRRNGYERVIAVGGDGTLFEVVNGLWGERQGEMPSVGMVPFGTGCDYIRNFEAGSGLTERLHTAMGESVVPVSLGLCRFCGIRGEAQRKAFMMVLGVGFDAEVIRHFRSRRLVRSGWIAYVLSVFQQLRRVKPLRLNGAIDGVPFNACAPFFAAGLGRYFGRRMAIAPGSSPSSGTCQLVWAESMSNLDLLSMIPLTYFGAHVKDSRIRTAHARRITLDSDPPAWIEADGELLGKTPLELEILPGALRFAAKRTK